MTDPIKPALTPEEWEGWAKRLVAGTSGASGDVCHMQAALYLYGQPFGFTDDDVDTIREAARYISDAAEGESDFYRDWNACDTDREEWTEGSQIAARLLLLADRIAALLPPREEQ